MYLEKLPILYSKNLYEKQILSVYKNVQHVFKIVNLYLNSKRRKNSEKKKNLPKAAMRMIPEWACPEEDHALEEGTL